MQHVPYIPSVLVLVENKRKFQELFYENPDLGLWSSVRNQD